MRLNFSTSNGCTGKFSTSMMPKVYLDDTDDSPTFPQMSLVADAHALREVSLEILHELL